MLQILCAWDIWSCSVLDVRWNSFRSEHGKLAAVSCHYIPYYSLQFDERRCVYVLQYNYIASLLSKANC